MVSANVWLLYLQASRLELACFPGALSLLALSWNVTLFLQVPATAGLCVFACCQHVHPCRVTTFSASGIAVWFWKRSACSQVCLETRMEGAGRRVLYILCLAVGQSFVLQNPNFASIRVHLKVFITKWINVSASSLETQLLCVSADSHWHVE